MDFDGDGIYYSQQNLQRRTKSNSNNDGGSSRVEVDDRNGGVEDVDGFAVRRHFREFLRNYHHKDHQYVYRKKLLQMHRRQLRSIELDLSHLREYDAALMDYVLSQPNTVLPFMESACIDALQTLLLDNNNNNNNNNNSNTTGTDDQGLAEDDPQLQQLQELQQQGVQLLMKGNISVTALRSIQSQHMNQLVKVRGIVISAAKVRSRATKVALACTKCAHRTSVQSSQNFFANIPLPTTCTSCTENNTDGTSTNGQYSIVPDECDYMDQQTLKLQEAPETVPTGEMPRSVLCCVDRTLVDQAPPGTRCTVICIASLSGRAAYLHIVGMDTNETNKHGTFFTPQEENAFRLLSKRSNIYELLTQSIAPSIQGDYTVDVKKALLCMLMSGCRKKLPDGCVLRGDINVLLLGDPSMAKSQFLKYAVKVAPIGVYTSGKGSSAAGLTASVVRDKRGEFYLEGGAMVLADGGLVAIDEFDKMNVTDRVAIHEAMEQQTISIAKAGITTVLNSRTSVLAAANPVHGRYDELKSSSENIDLLSTILSRFDFIFLLKDAREAKRDKAICQHIMGVHIQHSTTNGNSSHPIISDNLLLGDENEDKNAEPTTGDVVENALQVATTGTGELSVATMKKYISFCRSHCQPRLSEEAGDLLASAYVKIRSSVEAESAIPITVRQLEALVRVSESLAKLRLQEEVSAPDVSEALRLFRVSTMAAQQQPTAVTVHSDEIRGTEQFLTSRLTVGITVNQQRIVEEAVSKGYNAISVAKVLSIMVSRGQLQERNQGKLLKRIR